MGSVCQRLPVSNTTQTSALVGQHVNACMCLIQPRHHLYGVSIPMLACVWYYPDISSMGSVCQCIPVYDTTQTSVLWGQYANACLCMIQPRHQFYGVSMPMLACVWYNPDINSMGPVCQCRTVSDTTQTSVLWGQYANAYLCLIQPRHQFYGGSMPMITCLWYNPDISSIESVFQCLPVYDTAQTSVLWVQYAAACLCLTQPRHQNWCMDFIRQR